MEEGPSDSQATDSCAEPSCCDACGDPDERPGLLGYALHGRGGLTVEYIYTGEVFNNMRGGLNTNGATEYLGLFDLALTADLDQMSLMPGGTLFLLAEDSHGRGITDDHVGDYQVVSNIDGGKRFTQVSEFWWERSIGDGLIRVRLGKQDANADFGVVDLGGDFVNSSFGMQPNILMPAWPDPAMGVVPFLQFTERLELKVGVFDGGADGRTWGFSDTGTTFTIGELKAQWGLLGGRLPGDFHVGIWYHSDQFVDVAPLGGTSTALEFRRTHGKPGGGGFAPLAPGDVYAGNHGVYLGMDQMVLMESWDDEDDQGLGVFAQYGWAPKDRNEVHHYIGGGVVRKGLIRGRDDDFCGAGVAHVIFSDHLPDSDHDTVIELFYKAQVNPWTVVQPDLQYIVSPGGDGRDAFVAGLRFEVVL
jgi:porin